MRDLGVMEGAAVLVGDDGHITEVGDWREIRERHPEAAEVEVDGVLFPGFVDSHTHAVFGIARLDDHERRARGVGYKEIAAAGGGILSSVRDVRTRTADELRDLTRRRLARLLAHGSTTIEVKSGYGLSLEAELKQLSVIGELSRDGADLVPTFLGAHEVPEESRPDTDAYVDLVVHEMLPEVERQGIARFCDVFCEPGVFSVPQSKRVLVAAAERGLRAKLHADELDGSGGAELASELGAISADHLAAISEPGIRALAASQTVAVLLPGTMMFLGSRRQAPGRALIDAGAAVALATDFNPGSSPGLSLPLMATLAASQLGMVPAEAVAAITVNGAAAVGEAGTRGQIAPGFRADMVLAAVRDWRELVYWYGANLVSQIWVAGSACNCRQAPVDFLV